jgi:hypothetical protein
MSNYKEKTPYYAKVTGQRVVKKKNGDYALVLTTDIKGEQMDRYNPNKGLFQAEPGMVEVWLGFDGRSVEETFKVLKHLGFDHLDISLLAPESPGHYPLAGKLVTLTMSRAKTGDKEFWNITVPLPPKKTDLADLKDFVAQNQESFQLAREAIAQPGN